MSGRILRHRLLITNSDGGYVKMEKRGSSRADLADKVASVLLVVTVALAVGMIAEAVYLAFHLISTLLG